MKRLILVFLILFSMSISAQHYRVGSGLVMGLPNDYAKASGGFGLFVEYKSESEISFRSEAGFTITNFKEENVYLADRFYALYWLEGSLVYYPFITEYEPFISGGIGYYFFSTNDFNKISTATQRLEPGQFSNKFSYHIKTGFALPLSGSIKLIFQTKYLLLKQNLIVLSEELINDSIRKRTFDSELDLSTIFITVGAIIKI